MHQRRGEETKTATCGGHSSAIFLVRAVAAVGPVVSSVRMRATRLSLREQSPDAFAPRQWMHISRIAGMAKYYFVVAGNNFELARKRAGSVSDRKRVACVLFGAYPAKRGLDSDRRHEQAREHTLSLRTLCYVTSPPAAAPCTYHSSARVIALGKRHWWHRSIHSPLTTALSIFCDYHRKQKKEPRTDRFCAD